MLDKPICPRCGRESVGVCAECMLEKNPVRVDEFGLEACECGLLWDRGRWSEDMEDTIEFRLRKNLHLPEQADDVKVDYDYHPGEGELAVELHVCGRIGDSDFNYDKEFRVPVRQVTCPDCGRVSAGYYEAVIQARTPDFNPPLDDKKVVDIREVRGGVDVYLTSASYAKTLCNRLAGQGFLVKESKKLYGMKDGVQVHRFYFSVKKPGFNEGDVVSLGKRRFLVLRMGRDVLLQDIDSGSRLQRRAHRLNSAKVVAEKAEVMDGVVCAVDDGGLVVELESGEKTRFEAAGNYSPGDRVAVAFIEGENRVFRA